MAQISNLQEVRIIPKSIDNYIPIVGEERINRLKELAKPLKGKKVLNINATAYGGGVAELLKTQVALMQDLGIDASWRVMSAQPEFYDVTKKFHNTLQGTPRDITEDDKRIYLENVKANSKALLDNYDYVMIHDPQPLAMLDNISAKTGTWIWRCHIDTSTPNDSTWQFLYPYMQSYDAVVFTLDEFVKEDAKLKNLTFIPPSIDPLSPKNNEMDENVVNDFVLSYGVDPNRPIVCQVSRFDPWKDPLGVIDVYRNIKYGQVADQAAMQSLQLVMIAGMASDDPEGWTLYDRILRRAGEDFDLKIYTNLNNIGDTGVKAFQYASDVLLQKSLKEGFGLTVSEGLWKGKPLIGGNVGGIKIQIEDGVNGFLVNNVQEATEKTAYLLENPEEAKKMGAAGKEIVREKFLSIREIEDHLKLFHKFL